MKDPDTFTKALMAPPYIFKLKGTGEIKHHLGMEFSCDKDGTLCLEQSSYLDKLLLNIDLLPTDLFAIAINSCFQ